MTDLFDNPLGLDGFDFIEFCAPEKGLLETAFGIRPDADIAAHLGEVLWTQGNQERAKAIWRESLRLNPDNETLRETLQRLNIKL